MNSWKSWLLIGLAATGCGCVNPCGDDACVFTESDWETILTLSPVPEVTPDNTNSVWDNPGAQRLGQMLFFETRYAGPLRVSKIGNNGGLGELGQSGKVACVSCHVPSAWFMDTRTNPNNVSLGTSYTSRNAPSLVNTVFYSRHGWAGRQDTLWNQSSTSPESNDNTGGDRCNYARMLFNHYKSEYEAVFPQYPLPAELAETSTSVVLKFPLRCKPKSLATDPDGNWEKMAAEEKDAILRIMSNQGKAVAAYETLLVSRNAPFDDYVAGDDAAISDAAKRGLLLFIGKAACVDCHSGPLFTNEQYHNVAVPQEGENVPLEDTGRYSDVDRLLKHPLNTASKYNDDPSDNRVAGLALRDEDKGKFRTPTLRHIAETPPYFHTGSAASLTDVVEHYNQGGAASGFVGTKDTRMRPLGLTPDEVADIVAFLGTLTGEEVPEQLRRDIRVLE